MLTESTTNLEKVVPEAHDFLPLLGTDHVVRAEQWQEIVGFGNDLFEVGGGFG